MMNYTLQTQLIALFAFLLILAISAGSPNAMFLSLSQTKQTTPYSAVSPSKYGVNMGHRCEGDFSWLSFTKYLGVKKARSFNVGGTSSGISFTNSPSYGLSLSGVQVQTQTLFNVAIAQLRTFNGHNPSYTGWSNPVNWAAIYSSLSSSNGVEGDPDNAVRRLSSIGVTMLAVMQLGCSVFSFSTMDQTKAAYWQERWVLYRIRYAVATWAWQRGISDIEFWNEPDVSSNTCITSATWLDMYTLSSMAIQHAYSDMYRDFNNNLVTCILPPCPTFPKIYASAFAQRTFSGVGYYGNITVRNEHTLFPPFANNRNSSWYNLNGYSYHNYGKAGSTLGTDTYGLLQQVLSVHDTSHAPPLPIQVTEHAAHTSSSWTSLSTSSDDILEASRLASQVLLSAKYGFENFIYKFSMTVSSFAGQVK